MAGACSLDPGRPYREYIEWLRQQDLSKAEAFWRQGFKGFLAPTQLTADQGLALAPGQELSYGREEVLLSDHVTAGLLSITRQNHLTFNTLLAGAWAILLWRYSGERDTVWATWSPDAPPEMDGVESIVGLFINTLAIRPEVLPEMSLLDWLHRLQEKQIEIRQYEYSPLVKVQRWSEIPRGVPLFHSILVYDHYPMSDSLSELGNGSWKCEARSLQHTGYPLHVLVEPGPPMRLRLTYIEQSIDEAAASRVLEHLEAVFEGFIARPSQLVASMATC